jgi:hypothetical protein
MAAQQACGTCYQVNGHNTGIPFQFTIDSWGNCDPLPEKDERCEGDCTGYASSPLRELKLFYRVSD